MSVSAKKRGLGRGLESLLSSVGSAPADEVTESADEQRELSLASMGPGAHQPRRHFDEAALDELAGKLLDKAGEGDMTALKELGDRLDGKPAQTIGGDPDQPPVKLEISWAKLKS